MRPVVSTIIPPFNRAELQRAIFNRYFDPREGIKGAGQHHLPGLRRKFSWRAACACHRLRTRGIRGFARLGNYLMDSYQPKMSIKLFKISKIRRGSARMKMHPTASTKNIFVGFIAGDMIKLSRRHD